MFDPGLGAEIYTVVRAEFITWSMVIGTAVSLALSAAASGLQMLLAPKPKPQQMPDLGDRGQTVSRTTPIGFWRFIYGETKVGLHPVYKATTPPANHSYLHWLGIGACHEVNRIGTVFIGEHPAYVADLDADGFPTRGRFIKPGTSLPQVRIRKLLGTDDQAADPDLVSETDGEWTTDHRCRGHAGVYLRYTINPEMFPSEPNPSAVVQGKKVYDPRDGLTKWLPNPALCIRDYLLTARANGGFGAAADEIDEANFIAAANICDEFVDTPTTGAAAVSHTSQSVSASGDYIDISASDGDRLKFQTGDRVTIDDSLYGLTAATAYYVIVEQEVFSRQKDADPDNPAYPRISLATSYANALARTAIDLTADTGTLTITKTGEPRWTLNGTFTTDQPPRRIIEEMLSCCGGRLTYVSGKFRLEGLAWAAPSLTLDEDDLRGTFKVQTKRSRRDRFNALKGTYLNPVYDWQPSDYPALTSSTYETQDGGERVFNEYDQPYTSRSGQAQRAAKLMLARHRFERVVTYPAKLTAYDCKAGEIIAIDNDRWEWSAKAFEVIDRKPVIVEGDDEGGGPYLGIDLVLNEASEDAFDWASSEQQADSPVIFSSLPDWNKAPTPTSLTARTTSIPTGAGDSVYTAVFAWALEDAGSIEGSGRFEVQFRRRPGLALEFDGTDDYVEFGSQIELAQSDPPDFTVEMWLYWDGATGSDRGAFTNGQFWIWRRDSDGKIVASLDIQVDELLAVSTSAISADTWTHYAVTWDGQTLTLYVNGVATGTDVTTQDGTRVTEAGDTRITEDGDTRVTEAVTFAAVITPQLGRGLGDTAATAYWPGRIDDVRIWRHEARSAADILADMDEALTGREDGLTHYWPIDERITGTIFDATQSGNNGTISGAVYVDGEASAAWSPSWFVAGDQYSTTLPPLESAKTYDLRVRSVNYLGGKSDWATLSGYTVGSNAGAVDVIDYGLVTDSITDSEDWGVVTDAVTETRDYGAVV